MTRTVTPPADPTPKEPEASAALHDDDVLDGWTLFEGAVRAFLEVDDLAPTKPAVAGDQDVAGRVDNAVAQAVRGEAAENHGMRGTEAA